MQFIFGEEGGTLITTVMIMPVWVAVILHLITHFNFIMIDANIDGFIFTGILFGPMICIIWVWKKYVVPLEKELPAYWLRETEAIIRESPELADILRSLMDGPIDSLKKRVLEIQTSGYTILNQSVTDAKQSLGWHSKCVSKLTKELPGLETRLEEAKARLGLR